MRGDTTRIEALLEAGVDVDSRTGAPRLATPPPQPYCCPYPCPYCTPSRPATPHGALPLSALRLQHVLAHGGRGVSD